MFCPHLYCRNLGLPHVVGVSRAVMYMSLAGPNSIYRELETCPAKLVIWIQPLHYGIAWCSFETVMHISEAIHPLQVPQKVFFRMNFHQKNRTCEIWQSTSHIYIYYIYIFIYSSRNSCMLGIRSKPWLQHVVICSCHVTYVQVNYTYMHWRFAIKEKNQLWLNVIKWSFEFLLKGKNFTTFDLPHAKQFGNKNIVKFVVMPSSMCFSVFQQVFNH